MRKTTWLLAASITLGAGAAAAGPGISLGSAESASGSGLNASSQPWARWQARLLFDSAAPAWRSGLIVLEHADVRPARLSLLGDYYLTAPASGNTRASGLRATGGVLLGPRAQPWIGQPLPIDKGLLGNSPTPSTRDALSDSGALPYVGVGYMAAPGRNGWSFGADLGLVGQSLGGATRLGAALGRGQSLDDAVRDLRLTPLFQVGVSYSF